MSSTPAEPAWLCRPGLAMRAMVLAVVGMCQMPLPVGHDHGDLVGAGRTAATVRHLALFHAGDVSRCGWHFHLIPSAFWGGGGADDATGIPAPESDGGHGVPLVDFVSGTIYAPVGSAADSSIVLVDATEAGWPIGAMFHFLQTYGPGSELSDLLSVARC